MFADFIIIIILYIFYLKKENRIEFPKLSLPITISKNEIISKKIGIKATLLKEYIQTNNFSNEFCFLIDMSLHSGQKRFFIYNLQEDSIIHSGLVAHGSCNTTYLQKPNFSNTVSSGCSSLGKFKIGYSYKGQFGKAYKLFGLDKSNSNAFERAVVLHAYKCVPDEEVYPDRMCNSLGCPMVSYQFLEKASEIIDTESKPVLLWIFN